MADLEHRPHISVAGASGTASKPDRPDMSGFLKVSPVLPRSCPGIPVQLFPYGPRARGIRVSECCATCCVGTLYDLYPQ
jgi:hypothetical protein